MSATNDDGVAPPTVKDDEQNHQIELNKLSETENVVTNEEQKEKSHGKRRRRTHKKTMRKRSPEYYQELKLEKLKEKREQHWNPRFTNDSIPDLLKRRPKNRRFQSLKRNRSPIQNLYNQNMRMHSKLPNLTTKTAQQKPYKKTSHKPFKIRPIIPKRQSRNDTSAKQIIDSSHTQEFRTQQNKQQLAIKTSALNSKQQFIHDLEELSKQKSIDQYYKSVLLELNNQINEQKNALLRGKMSAQLIKLKNQTSIYNRIVTARLDRYKLIQLLKSQLPTIDPQLLQIYQKMTLALIQIILKAKQAWERIARDDLGQPKKYIFVLNGQNALTQICKDVQFAQIDSKIDPFLIHYAKKGSKKENPSDQNKEIALKIRACELLFLEEELIAKIHAK